MPPNSFDGIVTKTGKMYKTCTVIVTQHFEHPKYFKLQTHRRRYLVHDEKEVARLGDKVRITHVGPFSKRKQFAITQIDRRGLGLTPETDTAREGKTAIGTAQETLGINIAQLRAKASIGHRSRGPSQPTSKAGEVKQAESQRTLASVWNRAVAKGSIGTADGEGSGVGLSGVEAMRKAIEHAQVDSEAPKSGHGHHRSS